MSALKRIFHRVLSSTTDFYCVSLRFKSSYLMIKIVLFLIQITIAPAGAGPHGAAWAFWSPLQRWEGLLGCVRLRLHRFVPGFPLGAPSLNSRPGLQPRSCAVGRHLGASCRPRDQRPLLAGWVWRNTAWGRVFDARTIIGHPPAAQVPFQITKL